MDMLSKSYRNDAVAPLDSELTTYLDNAFLSRLPHLTANNPKILVVFSGGNAVGKSSLAQRISDDLSGLVLENDDIKRCLKRRYPDLTNGLSSMTWSYTMGLYARLDTVTPNGLIVRDGVIDWYYDRILPIFERAGYRLFVIAYDISVEKSLELITVRGDTDTTNVARLRVLLQEHALHQTRFRRLYTPDITLKDETLFDYDPVIARLRDVVASNAASA